MNKHLKNGLLCVSVSSLALLLAFVHPNETNTSPKTTYEVTFHHGILQGTGTKSNSIVTTTWTTKKIPVVEEWNLVFTDSTTGKKVRILDNVIVREQ